MDTSEARAQRPGSCDEVDQPQRGRTSAHCAPGVNGVNGAAYRPRPTPNPLGSPDPEPSPQEGLPKTDNRHASGIPGLTWWGDPDPALRGRTRLFIPLAVEHGPRLAALVFLVAIHTNGKHRRGRRGRKNAWHKPAGWYGEQLGVSVRQVGRLMAQAAELGLLDYQRTGRGLLVWIVGKRPWQWLDDHFDRGEYVLGHYDVRLAKGLGIVASCLLDLLDRPITGNNDEAISQFCRLGKRLGIAASSLSELVREAGHEQPWDEQQADREREYRQLSYKDVSRLLPWITEREADFELRRLHHLGLIKRRALDRLTAGVEETRWIYYSQKSLQKTSGHTSP